jgi:hypothetical protein
MLLAITLQCSFEAPLADVAPGSDYIRNDIDLQGHVVLLAKRG